MPIRLKARKGRYKDKDGNVREYQYNTIAIRDEFLDKLLNEIGKNHKDIIELLIDCNHWNELEEGVPLITEAQMKKISIYMMTEYTRLRQWAEKEIIEYNAKVNEERKKKKLSTRIK